MLWKNGTGRREEDLVALRAEAVVHPYIYWWFALHFSGANAYEPKTKKKFWPSSHVVSRNVAGVEAMETALMQREKHSSASASAPSIPPTPSRGRVELLV